MKGLVDHMRGSQQDGKRKATRAPAPRRMAELHLLRYVPGESPVHHLWAGTKLVVVVAFSVALSYKSSWRAEGILAACLGVTLFLARIPWSARPRLPGWIFGLLVVGAAVALLAGGAPTIHVSRAVIGFGSLARWGRFIVLMFLLLLGSSMLGWTTPLADLAPALARLLAPLRRLRLPVEELVIASALSVRCLPLLYDELRVLLAARRVRRPTLPEQLTLREAMDEGVDLLVSAFVTSTRRARQMGEAIEARGGFGAISRPGSRPRWNDAVALLAVAGVVTAMVLV